jgi:hypothetical protein
MNMQPAMRQPSLAGEITPERFAKLTAHLRVNGKPVENILYRLQAERRGDVIAAESAPA